MQVMEDIENLKEYVGEEAKEKLDKMQDDLMEVLKKENINIPDIRQKEIIKKRMREQFKRK